MKSMLTRSAAFLWKMLVGGALCQFAFTAIFVIGWTFRAMQRCAVKRWWKLSDRSKAGLTFREDAMTAPELRPFAAWPRWCTATEGLRTTAATLKSRVGIWAKVRLFLHGLFHSLKANFVLGIQGIFNVAVITAIPVLLWQFGWYAGWDNSFNKGYEQFDVGVTISLSGIFLFLIVMLYLPMAQARQAVTGDWRSFYQFKLVWRLVQRRRIACLSLAGAFSLCSIPLTISRVIPVFVSQNNETLIAMNDLELLAWANRYFFWMSVFGFIVYTFLRILTARIYAGAILEAYQERALRADELSPFERHMLGGLQLVDQKELGHRPLALKIVGAAARPPWRAAMTMATLLIWFTFVAQLYVSEFLVYHPSRGFINQPLVHLPWFRYVPDALEESANEIMAATK